MTDQPSNWTEDENYDPTKFRHCFPLAAGEGTVSLCGDFVLPPGEERSAENCPECFAIISEKFIEPVVVKKHLHTFEEPATVITGDVWMLVLTCSGCGEMVADAFKPQRKFVTNENFAQKCMCQVCRGSRAQGSV